MPTKTNVGISRVAAVGFATILSLAADSFANAPSTLMRRKYAQIALVIIYSSIRNQCFKLDPELL